MDGLDLMTDCVPNWPKDVIGLHDMICPIGATHHLALATRDRNAK